MLQPSTMIFYLVIIADKIKQKQTLKENSPL